MQFSRNQKISRYIQKELSEVFLSETKEYFRGLIISVTHVFVSKDHSTAKIYLSFFPTNQKNQFLNLINSRKNIIKNKFCLKIKFCSQQINSVTSIGKQNKQIRVV